MKKKQLFLTLGLLITTLQVSASAGGVAGPAAGGVTHTGAPAVKAPAMVGYEGQEKLIAPLSAVKYPHLYGQFSTLHYTFTPPAFIFGLLENAYPSPFDTKAEQLATIENSLTMLAEFEKLLNDTTTVNISASGREKYEKAIAGAQARLNAAKLIIETQPA